MAMLEAELYIPKHLVQTTSGFSIDIGGSLIKLAYFDTKASNKEDDKVMVHLITFDLDHINDALNELKEKLGNPIEQKVTTCGIGCMYQAEIIRKFNIQAETISEMHCFVRAFCFLAKNVEKSLILQPKPDKALEFAEKQYKEALFILENVIKSGKQDTPKDDEPHHFPRFPCFLAVFGSAGAFIKVEESGEYLIVEQHHRAGRTFLALSSLLLGTSDFNEVLDLASRGNHKALDVVYEDSQNAEDQDNLYAKTCASEGLFFAMGKAKGKNIGDFQREDLARALLVMECGDLAQVTHLTARAHGIQDIYISGSFISHPLVQYEFTRFMQIRTMFNPKDKINFEFLHHPGYYGALGGLMQDNMNLPTFNVDMATSTYTLPFLGTLLS